MPSDVPSVLPTASSSSMRRGGAHDGEDASDAQLSIGRAALRFVAMLVVTLASAVAMGGFEPIALATVVGLL